MRTFRRRYKRPQRPYDAEQIKAGKTMKKEYGLRRKKEIWIAQETLRRYRQRARHLIAVKNAEQEKALLGKLVKIGVLEEGKGLDDVLGLAVGHFLGRRLESIVAARGMVKTPRQARQAIVHGHVTIKGRTVVFPSYLVNREEEAEIACSFTPPGGKDTTGRRGVVEAPPGQEAVAGTAGQEES